MMMMILVYAYMLVFPCMERIMGATITTHAVVHVYTSICVYMAYIRMQSVYAFSLLFIYYCIASLNISAVKPILAIHCGRGSRLCSRM